MKWGAESGQEETHPYEKHDEQTLAVYFPSKSFKVNVVLWGLLFIFPVRYRARRRDLDLFCAYVY